MVSEEIVEALTCIGVNEPIDCAAVSARDTVPQVLKKGPSWVADIVNTKRTYVNDDQDFCVITYVYYKLKREWKTIQISSLRATTTLYRWDKPTTR